MNTLVLLKPNDVDALLNKRQNESKFGEHVQKLTNVSNIYDQLKNLDVTHVIFGIPEDIGVFANTGKPGTCNAWQATLKILINIQSNKFTKAKNILILGHLDFEEEMDKISKLKQSKKKDVQKARKIVSNIDQHVSQLVYDIVKAGKNVDSMISYL